MANRNGLNRDSVNSIASSVNSSVFDMLLNSSSSANAAAAGSYPRGAGASLGAPPFPAPATLPHTASMGSLGGGGGADSPLRGNSTPSPRGGTPCRSPFSNAAVYTLGGNAINQTGSNAQLELLQAELSRLQRRAEEKRRTPGDLSPMSGVLTPGPCVVTPPTTLQQEDGTAIDMREVSRRLLDIAEGKEGEEEEEEEAEGKEGGRRPHGVDLASRASLDEGNVESLIADMRSSSQQDNNSMIAVLQTELKRLQLKALQKIAAREAMKHHV